MKRGDRVEVVTPESEYHGKAGVISEVKPDGQVVVNIEIRMVTWPIPFNAHDLELEGRLGKR